MQDDPKDGPKLLRVVEQHDRLQGTLAGMLDRIGLQRVPKPAMTLAQYLPTRIPFAAVGGNAPTTHAEPAEPRRPLGTIEAFRRDLQTAQSEKRCMGAQSSSPSQASRLSRRGLRS